jgi:hypothetical protein
LEKWLEWLESKEDYAEFMARESEIEMLCDQPEYQYQRAPHGLIELSIVLYIFSSHYT